jgi:hypothetical protein
MIWTNFHSIFLVTQVMNGPLLKQAISLGTNAQVYFKNWALKMYVCGSTLVDELGIHEPSESSTNQF